MSSATASASWLGDAERFVTDKGAGPCRSSPGRSLLGDRRDEVSPLELFFDLVFVFAVSQLSEHLVDDLTRRGTGETAVLLVAVFGIWTFTSWGVSFPQGGRAETPSIFAVLLLARFVNASIPRAFDVNGWLLSLPFLLCLVGQTVFAYVTATTEWLRVHYRSMLVWVAAEALLWVAGALAAPEARLSWWAVAAAVDVIGSWAAHPVPGRLFRSREVAFRPNRMVERSRLLLLIALGETVLTIGTATATVPVTLPSTVTAVLALTSTTSLWFLYFSGPDAVVTRSAKSASDRLRVARIAVNSQLVILADLIVVAVANEVAIEDPGGRMSVALALVGHGGALLYLSAQTWYLRALTARWSRPRVAALAVLLLTIPVTLLGTALISTGLIATVLVGVVLAARFSAARSTS